MWQLLHHQNTEKKQRNRSCLLWSATGFITGTRTSVWSEKLNNEKTTQTLPVTGRHCGRSLKMKVSTPFIVGLWMISSFFVCRFVCIMENFHFLALKFYKNHMEAAWSSEIFAIKLSHTHTHTQACAHLRTPKHREMFLPRFKVG